MPFTSWPLRSIYRRLGWMSSSEQRDELVSVVIETLYMMFLPSFPSFAQSMTTCQDTMSYLLDLGGIISGSCREELRHPRLGHL